MITNVIFTILLYLLDIFLILFCLLPFFFIFHYLPIFYKEKKYFKLGLSIWFSIIFLVAILYYCISVFQESKSLPASIIAVIIFPLSPILLNIYFLTKKGKDNFIYKFLLKNKVLIFGIFFSVLITLFLIKQIFFQNNSKKLTSDQIILNEKIRQSVDEALKENKINK